MGRRDPQRNPQRNKLPDQASLLATLLAAPLTCVRAALACGRVYNYGGNVPVHKTTNN
ncbi:hypothetical protein KGM_200628 [Danaus plexippus plexippus]|uniref:Uncharacterized protein n=1 Tax=Danaus plexippus plexippus TaxID=278856 RepID=A0A212EJB7_DANPL|nr:hypothetical protein KGM_200628 [Danaus plexippus plexippus]